VVAIERSRLRNRRRELEAVDGWAALVAGRYSLVPREESDGKRYYLLVLNSPVALQHARWTPREAEVVRQAARGLTGKGIAYTLGLTSGAVSQILGRAAQKVGLRSRQALTAVASSLFGAPPWDPSADRLTRAERDVLDLLRRGLSNADIAHLRHRSRHTVANQVSSILQKTGHASRRTLASRRPTEDR
jgi:DNA-binding NarL/FixJ family response regulator